jgi:ferric-dicitrate binding protein FerR (iron transport regulator)
MCKTVASAAASAIVAASMLLLPTSSLAESKIGVASAAKNQVHGIVGGTSRAVSAGSELFANETVRTGEASQAQLLFLDQTSLSVGARSEVRLDRFVYNPDRKAGNVVLEASRGAFRFVTGSQNPSNYTIKTPLATIGVRGTIFTTEISKTDEHIYVVQGRVHVHTPGRDYVLNAGEGLSLSANASQRVRWDPTGFASSDLRDPHLMPYPGSEDLDLRDQLDAIGLRSRPRPSRGGGGGGD